MITGFFTILGVLLGFYLARFSDVNKVIGEKVEQIKETRKLKYGEPFVVRPNEYTLEQEQIRAKEKAEEERETKIATGKWQK